MPDGIDKSLIHRFSLLPMGKGDTRTKKGKIINKSYGKVRSHKKRVSAKAVAATKAKAEKAAAPAPAKKAAAKKTAKKAPAKKAAAKKTAKKAAKKAASDK